VKNKAPIIKRSIKIVDIKDKSRLKWIKQYDKHKKIQKKKSPISLSPRQQP